MNLPTTVIYYRKSFSNFLLILLFLVLTFILPSRPEVSAQEKSSGTTAAPAQTSNSEQIKKLEDELKKTKAEKDRVNSQINAEKNVQTKLTNEATRIESMIRQSELQEQAIRLELQKLNLELSILKEEREGLEANLANIQAKIGRLDTEIKQYTNLLYKISMTSPTFLEKNSKFEDSVITEEKTKSIIRIIKSNLKEVLALETEVEKNKESVAAKEKEIEEIQSSKIAQEQSLQIQQQGLEWQKSNKEKLAQQARNQVAVLGERKEELLIKQYELERELSVMLSKAMNLPPSGMPVIAGTMIGRQGSTGFVTGSHLHFEYKLSAGGSQVNPELHRKNFDKQPMDNMRLTSSYGNRCFPYNGKDYCDFHRGADYVNYNGAPIYAVKSGKVDYFCDSYGGLGAIVFHYDGSRSLSWHIQSVPGNCKKLSGY